MHCCSHRLSFVYRSLSSTVYRSLSSARTELMKARCSVAAIDYHCPSIFSQCSCSLKLELMMSFSGIHHYPAPAGIEGMAKLLPNDSSVSTPGNTGRSLIRTIPLAYIMECRDLNLPHDRPFIEISRRTEWMSIVFIRPSASIHLPPSVTAPLPPTRPGSHPIVMKSFGADLHFHHKDIIYRLTGSFPQALQAH